MIRYLYIESLFLFFDKTINIGQATISYFIYSLISYDKLKNTDLFIFIFLELKIANKNWII